MATYEIRLSPQDGQPDIQTVEGDSIDHALASAYLTIDDVVSVQLVGASPRTSEPVGNPPPPAPRVAPKALNKHNRNTKTFFLAGINALAGLLFAVMSVAVFLDDEPDTTNAGPIFGFSALVFLLVAFAIAVSGQIFRGRSSRKRLYERGTSAAATVVSMSAKEIINGQLRMIVGYEYRVDGQVYGDEFITYQAARLGLSSEEQLWVLYDPDDPSRSIEWIPTSGSGLQ